MMRSIDKCLGPGCWACKVKLRGKPFDGVTTVIFTDSEQRSHWGFGPPPPPGSPQHNAYWRGIEDAYLAQRRRVRGR